MRLGLGIGYSGARLQLPMELIQTAERLGFDSVWTAEAYGSDAVTPLAFIAARTDRIRLGTGIMQLAGRSPAMCAMQAQTVDALAGGGRFIAGLGVSGPQIVEGWYGEPWGRPYWRLRDYIEIMRKIFDRDAPVEHHGREISLPYTGEGATGLGKPLRSILHTNPALPIWLGSGSEATVKLTAELCDGWLPDALRARPHGALPGVGGGGVPPVRRRPELGDLRDPGRHRRRAHRRPRRRRRGRPAAPEDGHRPVRRRHGSRHA